MLLAACASGDADAPADGKPKGKGPPPARVAVAEATAGVLEDARHYLGQVKPLKTLSLAPAVAGAVVEVNGRPGDRVTTGAVLVRLDTDLVVPEIAAARAVEEEIGAELAQARRELARARKRAHPIVTDVERERYQATVQRLSARLDGAKAQRRRLQAQLDRHQIAAPFDGVIRSRLAEPGAWLGAGAPAMELVSAEEVEVLVEVDPDTSLSKELEVTLLHDGQRAPARITGIIPALESATRAQRLRLIPDGARPPWLLPGMAVDVEFTVPLGTAEGGRVLVPRDALVRGPAGVRVIKIVEGKGVPIPVRVVATAGAQALVHVPEGLTPPSAPPLPGAPEAEPPPPPTLAAGDTLVVRGNERLRPGQAVQIIDDGDAEGGAQ